MFLLVGAAAAADGDRVATLVGAQVIEAFLASQKALEFLNIFRMNGHRDLWRYRNRATVSFW
ncbi:MAG: hypothetical protein QF464_10785 [Myxococcota bacterium]|nr:hypothetical protein [Myxococcota bacterium]